MKSDQSHIALGDVHVPLRFAAHRVSSSSRQHGD